VGPERTQSHLSPPFLPCSDWTWIRGPEPGMHSQSEAESQGAKVTRLLI